MLAGKIRISIFVVGCVASLGGQLPQQALQAEVAELLRHRTQATWQRLGGFVVLLYEDVPDLMNLTRSKDVSCSLVSIVWPCSLLPLQYRFVLWRVR